jgi:sporulation protein YlmC with PRC-barrel domain
VEGDVHIVRDLLDKQLIDVNWQRMGRVDGLGMELHDGEQPRIDEILVGGTVLTYRLPGFLGRWSTAFIRRFGIRHGEPFTIPWSRVRRVDRVVRVDVNSDESEAMASMRWVRDNIMDRIPGA